jgi:hypothetical protein
MATIRSRDVSTCRCNLQLHVAVAVAHARELKSETSGTRARTAVTALHQGTASHDELRQCVALPVSGRRQRVHAVFVLREATMPRRCGSVLMHMQIALRPDLASMYK